MSIVSPCLFRYGYTSPACSYLAQVCSASSTFICLKEAWIMWTEAKCLTVVVDIRPGFITMKPKILPFVTNKGSRQGKLRSQNLDEACLKRRYSVYLFETTTQGSVLKVGKLRLSGNHTVTEYEMSREQYRQKTDGEFIQMSEFSR